MNLRESKYNMSNEITDYLTVKECWQICRFKGPEPIRRAVYRGDLPGVRIRANRLLIPAKAFWKWFHDHDVKPKLVKEVDETSVKPVRKPNKKKAREEVAA
jgi:hypothetical protein